MENTRYAYSPLPERPPIRWPGDARVAFWVIPNIEHFRFDRPTSEPSVDPVTPDVPNIAKRDFGPRVGVWRLMEILDKYNLRATAALNADVCRYYPQIIEAGVQRNWEWMGHGITNSQRLSRLDEDTERRIITEATERITASVGRAPRGWLGPGLAETERTLDLLAEVGYTYVADWTSDEQPFAMRVQSGQMISVPYSHELNDFGAFLNNGLMPEQFYRMICDQFDVLYEEGERTGRVMALALHPYLSGHAYRAKWVDKALEYITGHSQVWFTTGGQIADWYHEHLGEQADLSSM